MIKIFSIFLDTRPFFEHFLKKNVFLPLKKLKTLKFSKIAKNEVKAVQVAVFATPHGMSAIPRGVSVAQHCVLVVPAALRGMLALQDTHGNTRGA